MRPYQFAVSHFITGSAVMVVQCLEFIIYSFYLTLSLSLLTWNFVLITSFLMLLMGFVGVLFGLLISVFMTNSTLANFATLMAFYPFLTLSGEFQRSFKFQKHSRAH